MIVMLKTLCGCTQRVSVPDGVREWYVDIGMPTFVYGDDEVPLDTTGVMKRRFLKTYDTVGGIPIFMEQLDESKIRKPARRPEESGVSEFLKTLDEIK